MTSFSTPVAIVGAGPAGLMAATRLAAAGCAVSIYERLPSPARKLLMAGRGGLNLTHSEPLDLFLSRYAPQAPALIEAVRAFPPSDLRAVVEDLGEPTFVGSSGRVFPKSFKASPLLRAWLARLAAQGVVLKTRHAWEGWAADGALRFATPDGVEEVRPAATLLALGGASWPRLGSDGGWVPLLQARGVPVLPFRPANMGVVLDWSAPMQRFAGAPLKRIALSCGALRVRGEAVITSTGLEGGAVYALSAAVRTALEAGGPAQITVDLRPDLDVAQLAAKLEAVPERYSLANRLRKGAGLSPVAACLLREAGALPPGASALAARIKAVPIAVTGTCGLERAISSAGGIAWDGVDDRFMLRAVPGVFACGEMLDWEAPTGGYLLQACFATGLAAAEGVLAHLNRAA
ncbi:TIGR03862 family flavoprotein [Aquabacter sp. L1I39]|uniref:NAD(P)/FAD-dependent oxidoreductase n=1 Tax=Aquabacter sp. L1I39 TaxID=2820278 RepID=UPI001ADAF9C0|nr:TIGR03862 family flavoprotein [Aquabacter sp. L1I39]QTL02997.1 TIGR03862 family flavoprotein [Aquabacter sp. L1I39]